MSLFPFYQIEAFFHVLFLAYLLKHTMFDVKIKISPEGIAQSCLTCKHAPSLPNDFFIDMPFLVGWADCLVIVDILVKNAHKTKRVDFNQFYSYPHTYALKNPDKLDENFVRIFQGAGRSLLCFTLKWLVKLGYIKEEYSITMQASKQYAEKQPFEKLLQYYKSFGFKVVDEAQVEDEYEELVKMEATVKTVLESCGRENKKSSQVKRFFDQQRYFTSLVFEGYKNDL